MTRSLRPCAIIIMLLGLFAASAHSADMGCASFWAKDIPSEVKAQRLWPSGVRPTSGTCRTGLFHGKIITGDYEKFLTFYRLNHPFLENLMLESPGGDVDEAIKIGRLLRKYLITAVSPFRVTVADQTFSVRLSGNDALCDGPDCICASSCALIWFGAPHRAGEIGLHRPRTEDAAFKALPAAEAGQAYRRTLDGIVRYLEEMETPRPLIDAMISTASADIRWFDVKTSGGRVPSFAEWIGASCGQLTREEKDKMI